MFNEQNSVENYIRDLLCGAQPPARGGMAEEAAPYIPLGRAHKGAGWYFVSALALPRRINDVFIEALAARSADPPEPRDRRPARTRR